MFVSLHYYLPGPLGDVWTLGLTASCSNSFLGTRQMLMHEKICVFPIFGPWGSCLNTRLSGRVLKHCPRDPASVNAMKQTCVIVINAYFTRFQHKPHWKRRLKIKYPFPYTWFLKTKWRHNQTFERHYMYVAITSYIRMKRFCERKHWRHDLSRPQPFPV